MELKEQIRYKMSEMQIKTALKCLSKPNSTPVDREKCYFMWKEPSCLSCHHEVAQNALALITSREQKIKELTEEVESLKQCMEHEHASFMEIFGQWSEKCDRLAEENERLRGENEALAISEVKECEISQMLVYRIRDKHPAVMAVIADTVRKMHSEIKDRCIKGGIYPAFVAGTIDQIAKEMVEGEK